MTGTGQIVGTTPILTPGRHTLQYYDRTATFETPTGSYSFDLTPYNAGDQGKYGSTVLVRASTTDTTGTVGVEIDNLVLKKVGW